MLVVGSKALLYHFPDIKREAKDTDVIGYKSDVSKLIDALNPSSVNERDGITTLIKIQNKTGIFDTENVEILIADDSESLKKYLKYDTIGSGSGLQFASAEVLFSLKKSHIHFPIHFRKHISDYAFLKNRLKIDALKEITKINYKETESRFGKLKTPSLNKSVKEFFAQSNGFVKSYFIHDDMHKAVSHYDRPLYLNMQKDITIAKCERDLWEKFTHEDKCKCVLEEAYVIALERKVLPTIFGSSQWISSEEALEWSLVRICTTLCSGWFREFATDNFFEIKKYVNRNYVEDFLEKYKNGDICRIE